jgi:coenzyme F420-0:L-glutamate ligase/coenzyme F420-1:gamma-L-glutamate ligase
VLTDLHIFAIPGIPDVTQDADLATLVANACAESGRVLEHGDVVVVAQKVVSKEEGAVVRLDDVVPSQLAAEWAAAHGKDARVIEIVLRESRRIVRMDRGILITETRHGFVCANAGVDASNVEPGYVTVLPSDPDASAERIRADLCQATLNRPRQGYGGPPKRSAKVEGLSESPSGLGVIISDTFGRPWREGVVNVAIGVAGLRPLVDYRGSLDAYGRRLESTIIALADELAAAAEIVTRKSARTPVAVVRGAGEWLGEGSARALVRESARDLFR